MRILSKLCVYFTALVCGTVSADLYYPYTGEIGLGYDYFRSVPEGDWAGNTGALVSLNLSMPMPALDCCVDDWGVGAQIGSSYGIYNWSGKDSAPSNKESQTQQQAFLTTALYRRTSCDSGINGGIAYDWMWNKNAGVLSIDHDLSQLRFRGGYICHQENEWGIWGTINLNTAHKRSQGLSVSFRAISQLSLYWEHYYENCARTMIWVGLPYKKSLLFSSGRVGQFLIGADFRVPLTCSWGIEGHACYMHGHSAHGALKQRNYAANIYVGLTWAFGDVCDCAAPYFSLGNNSNFIVDTSLTF